MTDCRRSGDLTRGPILRQTVAFGAPLALAMMGHGMFNLVDMVIVARLGPGAVAAVTIGGIILPLALVLFDGVINVTAAMVAQFHGAHHDRGTHDIAWESLIITATAGLGGGASFYFLSGPLVRFFQLDDAATTAAGINYLEVMSGGLIGTFLMHQTTAVLRGVGNSFWPMVILVGANLVNIALDVLLVFGYLGFPRLGVAGAAWATVISQFAGGLLGTWLLWRGTAGIALRRHRWRPPFHYLRTLIVVGLPTSVQLATRVLAVFFLVRIAREAAPGAGHEFLDGVGICVRIEMIAVFLGLGWAAAATPFVGQNLGAGQPGRAARGAWALVAWAAGTMSAIGLGVWLAKDTVIPFIMPEIPEPSLEYAVDYLRILVPFYGVLAVALVLSRALNGAGSTKSSMAIDVVLYLGLLLPLAAVLSQVPPLGGQRAHPQGAWWAAAIVHVVAAVLYVLVFSRGHWTRKRLARQHLPRPAPGSAL